MSVINKVLLDLDKRQAPTLGDLPPPANVKAIAAPSAGHEWFWRTVAFLSLIALGWVGWVVYQIQPRPIATELALEAAGRAARRPAPKPLAQAPVVVPPVAPPASVVPPATPPVAQPAVPAQAATAAKPVPQPEPMRFAYSIETPIQPPTLTAPPKPAAEPKPRAEAPKKPAADKPRFERRDLALSPADKAESEFRRGVDLLKRGRTTEAEAAFRSALAADGKHRGARQAQIALRMERGDLAEASRLLNETLVADPKQPDFAVALARIQVERGDLAGALTTLDAAATDAYGELHVLRGTVLQRMGYHQHAADAYRAALRTQAGTPQLWLGLGISLEALQKRPEAAQAFRNALAAGPVSSEVRTFAEQRIQALR
jgi:MSHA biogenesis protein MshN